jgi:co-chaperonin GroES (HSP10)
VLAGSINETFDLVLLAVKAYGLDGAMRYMEPAISPATVILPVLNGMPHVDALSEGEVVASGPGAGDESGKLVPLDVKAGERILFGKWSGTEVKLDGEELLIMKESDVMGIIEGRSTAKPKAA